MADDTLIDWITAITDETNSACTSVGFQYNSRRVIFSYTLRLDGME